MDMTSVIDLSAVWAAFLPGLSRWVVLNVPVLLLLWICQGTDWVTGLHVAKLNGEYKSKIAFTGFVKKALVDALFLPIMGLDICIRFAKAVVGDTAVGYLWDFAARLIPAMAEVEPVILDIGIGVTTLVCVFFISMEMGSVLENLEAAGHNVPDWLKRTFGMMAKELDGAKPARKD